MAKVVWIVNQYGSTPEVGMGGRHYYLARELARRGVRVYLIVAGYHHLMRIKPKVDEAFKVEEVSDRFSVVWVRVPTYLGARSKQRVLNWFLFAWRVRGAASVIPDRPDSILCSSPSPFAFLMSRALSKKFSARLLFEVRDIWPLTLTEIGGHGKSHPLIWLMQWVEKKAYRESHVVISNLENAVQHMEAHGLAKEKFCWIPNGFSLEEAECVSPLDVAIHSKIPKGKFVVGYAGTLGVANALDTLIDAAKELASVEGLVFVLVGGGEEALRLKEKAACYDLKNVIFLDRVAKENVYSVLEIFDVCFIGWKAEKLYRFGIAANKIPEYMFSGKPVLHAYGGGCDPIHRYGAGVVVAPEDVTDLVRGVLQLYRMSDEERMRMGANGRKAALKYYEYGELAERLLGVL
ncbi:glycosyltransferase family 4 protein [Halopseudomonas sp.]|uniref:glycosyltransferase family 4 protein n=1 Tax=Halopseudomonas sp. TaxID=2901191 RepID=UPI00311DB9A8